MYSDKVNVTLKLSDASTIKADVLIFSSNKTNTHINGLSNQTDHELNITPNDTYNSTR